MKNFRLTGLSITFLILVLAIWALTNDSLDLPPASVSSAVAVQAPESPQIRTQDSFFVQSENEPVAGTQIDLSEVPRDKINPASKYLRWLRGELDSDEREGFIDEEEREALIAAAEEMAPQQIQPVTPLELASSRIQIGVKFESMDFVNCCAFGFVPPDPIMAVGPAHIIAAVNVAFEIYNKEGVSLVPPTSFESLFFGVSGCSFGTELFDPNVAYDEEADRFILGIDAGGGAYCLAVSESADPTKTWIRYRFPTNGGGFFDFPQLGVGRDALYMGGNIFSNITKKFQDARVWAFDKWAIYSGSLAAWREKVMPTTEDTPQPIQLHGYDQGTWPTSSPHYFITETNFNGETYSLYSWSAPFGTNQISKVGTFNLDSAIGVNTGFPIDVPQPGGGTITANDWRPLDAEYRNGSVWTTNTISCNPGSGTVDCIRWAQINLADATVQQAGLIASGNEFRFFGDLAVNHCDDLAIGYTKTSPTNPQDGYPGIWLAGRYGSDPPNSIPEEFPLLLSNIEYIALDSPPRRWGDYTGLTVDPNGLDFWYIGQYSKATGNNQGRWGTYIGQILFPRQSQPGPPIPPGLSFKLYLPLIAAGFHC